MSTKLIWTRVSLSVVLAFTALGVSLTELAGIARSRGPVFPDLITLPADFGSEGIAVGIGHTFYVGSFTTPYLGQILVGDLRTGTFSELVPPSGRAAVGMKVDPRTNFLFVAGGLSGGGTIYDASSGDEKFGPTTCFARSGRTEVRPYNSELAILWPRSSPTCPSGSPCG